MYRQQPPTSSGRRNLSIPHPPSCKKRGGSRGVRKRDPFLFWFFDISRCASRDLPYSDDARRSTRSFAGSSAALIDSIKHMMMMKVCIPGSHSLMWRGAGSLDKPVSCPSKEQLSRPLCLVLRDSMHTHNLGLRNEVCHLALLLLRE
jgi:hypothetical protein